MEFVLIFVQGVSGLIAAIGTLLTGIASLLNAARRLRERRRASVETKGTPERVMWLLGVLSISVSFAILALRATTGEPQPKNVVLTTAAWNALNAKNYVAAIAKAQECVDEFGRSADREQSDLEKQKTPQPPKGKVTDAERQMILARGLLNDVATCYFIIGRSAEYLGRMDLARDAYGRASKYPYARTWDPGGWFWSPAEAAADRLAGLK